MRVKSCVVDTIDFLSLKLRSSRLSARPRLFIIRQASQLTYDQNARTPLDPLAFDLLSSNSAWRCSWTYNDAWRLSRLGLYVTGFTLLLSFSFFSSPPWFHCLTTDTLYLKRSLTSPGIDAIEMLSFSFYRLFRGPPGVHREKQPPALCSRSTTLCLRDCSMRPWWGQSRSRQVASEVQPPLFYPLVHQSYYLLTCARILFFSLHQLTLQFRSVDSRLHIYFICKTYSECTINDSARKIWLIITTSAHNETNSSNSDESIEIKYRT